MQENLRTWGGETGLWLLAAVLVLVLFAINLGAHPALARAFIILTIGMTAALLARLRRIERSLGEKTREALEYLHRSELDTRQRKQAEEGLQRSLKDLEDVKYALDRSTIVATTDRLGTITYANDKFCEISKYSREELVGQNHRIVNSGLHPHEFFQDMWRTIGGGRLWHGEIRNRAKDGTFYWVDTTIVPFLDDQRHPYQYVAIRHDITERKRVEAEMREQAALTRLGEMATVVAHEVKNPLAGVRGALEIIGRRMPAESPNTDIIKEMVVRIDSLNQMVQDLLVFARPVAPKIAPVSIGMIVRDTTAFLKTDPEMHGVTVDVSGPEPIVPADANMIKAALLNLMINAAQAMGRQGRISISISLADGYCTIRVRDEGLGIAEDVRGKIFEPFFTTKHRGTGLGLPVARRTVEMHGGTLRFECPPEGGTIMILRLPVPQQA